VRHGGAAHRGDGLDRAPWRSVVAAHVNGSGPNIHGTQGRPRHSDENGKNWEAIVRAVSQMPDVIVRLTRDHVPDPQARCRACTEPGTGRPNAPWPCSLRKLADGASRLRTHNT
jgi:hypothetical protein